MSVLDKGDKFAGCVVEASEDKEGGHVWIFVRGNEAIVIGISYDDYFTMIANPHERERIFDQMAAQIYATLKDRAKGINSLQSNW